MRPDDLLKLLRGGPFRPFRIHLTDGSAYEVHHLDWAVVHRSTVDLAFPTSADPEFFHDVTVALLHITRIRLLTAVDTIPSVGG
jgi:hypothetical protein